MTIREAARSEGIKFSTAKTILKVYRREGRLEKKSLRPRKATQMLSERSIPEEERRAGIQTGLPGNVPTLRAKANFFCFTTREVVFSTVPAKREEDDGFSILLRPGFWATQLSKSCSEKSNETYNSKI